MDDATVSNGFWDPDDYMVAAPLTPLTISFTHAAKIDIQEAFMQLLITTLMSYYLCFECDGKVYRYLVCVWGTNFAPYAMSLITNAFCYYIMAIEERTTALGYLDDSSLWGTYLVVEKALALFYEILDFCELKVSKEKSSLVPTKEIDWLGFVVNSTRITVSERRQRKIY